jgi:predicted nucleic acid-binding protein
LAVLEVTSVFHRHIREGFLSATEGHELMDLFRQHATDGLWNLLPVTDALLYRAAVRVRSLPAGVLLRAADLLHLVTAVEAGEPEIWTSDRHMLAAAPHFGILGRSA